VDRPVLPDPLRRAVLYLAAALPVAPLVVAAARGQDIGQASGGVPRAAPPLVAAAADLQFALAEVATRFREATGQVVRLSFGSSGNIARQIEQGSPVELFLSADEAFVLRLVEGGYTRGRGALYAIGRIALFTPPGSPVRAAGGMGAIRDALDAGRIARFAIANPEHAPYGRAAEQALRAAGLWERIRPHLVLGENVAQAAQFALAGGSQGGIVAYSLALAPAMRARGDHAPLPGDLHAPLRQRMALTHRAGPAAERFYAYLQGPEARAVMVRHGFLLPDE
jgi:molybdate transport system substrate-binding protein